jgi:hypothetical protein
MARPSTLHVPAFSGGVVRLGSTDAQQVTELAACEKFDIGDRGQLVLASDLTDYTSIHDSFGGGADPGEAFGLGVGTFAGAERLGVLVRGLAAGPINSYLLGTPAPEGAAAVTSSTPLGTSAIAAQGALVTFAGFPFLNAAGVQMAPQFVNVAARSTQSPRSGPGLVVYNNATATFKTIDQYDALGTGPLATDGTVGTRGKKLFFRGIAAYNGHLFGWGFDNADAANGAGPNRLMFSNLANPFKFGNDNIAASGDRPFTDSDALVIGEVGEEIRAALAWRGKLWIATNRELHYLAGYGRESFQTDGVVGVHRTEHACGPHGLCEGPDGMLYGLSASGLWAFDGSAAPERLYRKLRDFAGRSPGWFDCLWTDTTRAVGYPGQTNLDLAWLVSVPEAQQVWCVIPFCDATAGYGFGADTVVIKYHVETGGFTKQTFPGVALTHGAFVRQTPTARGGLYVLETNGTGTGRATVRRYAARATPATPPVVPATTPAPTIQTIPYAPFGPDGAGICRKVLLTLAWESAAALPLHLALGATVDDESVASCRLSIAAVSPESLLLVPAEGDLWLDTSGTDAAIGVGTAGAAIAAGADYVLKRHRNGAWTKVYGAGGQKGARATVPVAFPPRRGTRVQVSVALDTTVATPAAGRFQLEGLGLAPAQVQETIT